MALELYTADANISTGPVPAEVLAYWRQKGLKPTFSYLDIYNEEHDYAFAAAKIMRDDVLVAMKDELERAFTQGVPFDQWKKQIEPRMRSLGWWDKQQVIDPQSGRMVEVDPPARLRTIFQTNMRTARAVGQYDRIQRSKRFKPYLLYQVGPSEHHRPQHLAWHGTLLPVDDPFWKVAFPPNGWGCRCSCRSVSKREADDLDRDGVLAPDPDPIVEDGVPTGHLVNTRIPVKREAPVLPLVPWENRRTGKVEFVPQGIDPGFNHTPGEGRRIALGMGGGNTPSSAPTTPAPRMPEVTTVPTPGGIDKSLASEIVRAVQLRDATALKNAAVEVRDTMRDRYKLPEPARTLNGDPEIYDPSARHDLDGLDGFITWTDPGDTAAFGISAHAPDAAVATVHEMAHLLGGALEAYDGNAQAAEEWASETLAKHFTGTGQDLSIRRPDSAALVLSHRAATFEFDLANVTVGEQVYPLWRARVALAIAQMRDEWDPVRVNRAVNRAAILWKRTSYRTVESALDALVNVLGPETDEQRSFLRTVLIDSTWGPAK